LSGPEDGNHPIIGFDNESIEYFFLYDYSLFEEHFPQELNSNYWKIKEQTGI